MRQRKMFWFAAKCKIQGVPGRFLSNSCILNVGFGLERTLGGTDYSDGYGIEPTLRRIENRA